MFLGDRELGGRHLADAVVDNTAMQANMAPGTWSVTTTAIRGNGDARTLFVYARSSLSGQEAVMPIPVLVGEIVHLGGGGEPASAAQPAAAASRTAACLNVPTRLPCGSIPRPAVSPPTGPLLPIPFVN